MKVTLLGHASVLVEMADAVCLMDPVLFDPFEEGAVTSCPKRSVFPDRLPRVDTLIVSHRHPDHFDPRSLALVPRDADVIVPGDPLIAYALNALGFRHIHPVAPMAPIRSERFELFPTRSEITTVREFGMVFKDASGTFWNQVDSELSPATIDAVRQRFARPDLLFAMYASQNFDYFDRRSIEFPYETHRQNLANVVRIDPHTVAPGAAGFRFCGAHAWLNPFLFPISRRRFAEDLERLGFRNAIAIMNPGDVFDIASGRVVHGPGASAIAVMDEDDSAAIDFDPTAPVPALSDPNLDGRSRTRSSASSVPSSKGLPVMRGLAMPARTRSSASIAVTASPISSPSSFRTARSSATALNSVRTRCVSPAERQRQETWATASPLRHWWRGSSIRRVSSMSEPIRGGTRQSTTSRPHPTARNCGIIWSPIC